MSLGASFSPRRASNQGLDWQAAFQRLLALELSPLRLSAFWDDVDGPGHHDLDWQLAEAERAGRDVVLSVGMKAQGWPEFAIPEGLEVTARRGVDVGAGNPALREAVLEFVHGTVQRYRKLRRIVAWQVENEPVNPSGRRRWWISPDLVRDEIAEVRRADASRPIVVNAFASFNWRLDVAACRHGLRRVLGRDADRPEAEVLGLLQPGDILGLDVYRRIGYFLFGSARYTTSNRWLTNAERWHARAAAERKRAWIVEAQAEPWEPSGLATDAVPRSCVPADVIETVTSLRGVGYDTILLWGVEHMLTREDAGDSSWLEAVASLQERF